MREKLMTTERQQQLVDAVKLAADLHAEGTPASAALAKIAVDRGMNDHELKLMVDAFNTAKTLAHLKTSEDKMSSFELADFDAAVALAFPPSKNEKGASERTPRIPDQRVRTSTEKRAYNVIEKTDGVAAKDTAELQRLFDSTSGDLAYKRAFRDVDYWRKKADEHRAHAEGLCFKVVEASQWLSDYFHSPDRVQEWPTFVNELKALHGPVGEKLASAMESDFGIKQLIARHGCKAAGASVPNEQSEAHQWAFVAIEGARLAGEHRVCEQRYRAKHAQVYQQLLDMGKSEGRRDKRAFDATTAMTMNMANALKPEPSKAPDFDLTPDVGLESEYGNVKTRMELEDMIANDEVIGQHASEDPGAVMRAVQELSQLQPNILRQPMVLRAALRRHLELGQTEPHELEQIRRLAAPDQATAALSAMNPGGV